MSTPTARSRAAAARVPPEHAVLARRIRSGDQTALAELYDRYSARILGAIVGLAPDRESAEEAVHDAFLAAWCGINRFDAARGDLESWLMALALKNVPGGRPDR
ncbi:MAG: hypothetical protein K5924_02100 [Chloroflexi bacterium]|nr:hypothetical protein [Chloroflexota bacterium]